MSSCSPSSLVFDSSPSLKPLKASGSLPSFTKFSFFKLTPSYSDYNTLKASGTIPSLQDTLNEISKIKLPTLSNKDYSTLKASITPKSLDYTNFNFPKTTPLKASGTMPSWQDTLNKINEIKLPNLSNSEYNMFKASATPKSMDYSKFNFNFPKTTPLKASGTMPSWQDTLNKISKIKLPSLSDEMYNTLKASITPKSIDYSKLNTSMFGFKKNSLEASVSPISFLDKKKVPIIDYGEKEPFKNWLDEKDKLIFGTPEWNKKYNLPEFKPLKILNKEKIIFDWEKNLIGTNKSTFNSFEKKEPKVGSTEWYSKNSFNNYLTSSDAQETKDNYHLWNEDIKLLPINKLFGHKTNEPTSLFRKGAKSHFDLPIETIPIGDNYLIDHGVGRSMRAYKNGESSVFGVVDKERSYWNVQDIKDKKEFGPTKDERIDARADLNLWEDSTKIIDKERWRKLGDELLEQIKEKNKWK